MAKKAKTTKKKRAHWPDDGTFKADDPATPDVNEAFVPEESEKHRESQRAVSGRYLGGKLVD